MGEFELTFTDKNNILRVNSKESEELNGATLIELSIHDKNEAGAPRVVNLTPDGAQLLCSHILSLVRVK